MKHFYQQVYADPIHMRFAYRCPVCGQVLQGKRIPYLCRRQIGYDKDEPHHIFGVLYRHARAISVQHIARYVNQCIRCGRFVCDSCYDEQVSDGMCKECADNRQHKPRHKEVM